MKSSLKSGIFTVSLDYYNIKIDDRVLLTNPLGFDGDDTSTNAVEQVLIDNGIGNKQSDKFFSHFYLNFNWK